MINEMIDINSADCVIMVWKPSVQDAHPTSSFGESGDMENKESWTATKVLRYKVFTLFIPLQSFMSSSLLIPCLVQVIDIG